jgi:tRNA pseudouridine55 synthase
MRLGCGAVLAGLVREYSHPFALEQAWRLDDILDAPDTLPERVLPLQAGLPGWPVLTLDAVQERAVRAGTGFAASHPAGVKAVLADLHGRPLALAEAQAGNWRILRGLWF